MSDFLHKQEGRYQLGLQHLNPTLITVANEKDLFTIAIDTVTQNQKKLKATSENFDDYQNKMSEMIYKAQLKAFEGQPGEQKPAQEEMKNQIDKNITLQETFEIFNPIL